MPAEMYDYIIAGTGCAGLSLAYGLSKSELKNKKVLLIDRQPKTTNDRTWCFWTKNPTPFDNIVYKKWPILEFYGENFSKKFSTDPYSYQMIRGIDFYNFTQTTIQENTKFEWLYGHIDKITENDDKVEVQVEGKTYLASFVFDSRWDMHHQPVKKPGYHYLYQHFKGWIIETPNDFFEKDVAHFMDFRIEQVPKEARFMYLLPFNPRQALVEFTIFSENLLQPQAYDPVIKNYLKNFIKIDNYSIQEEEFGIIPMFDAPLLYNHSEKIIPIGTLAGRAKPSSGYAFIRIQQATQQIIQNLLNGRKPNFIDNSSVRFVWYDSALLNVISQEKWPARKVFTRLFERHPIDRIFRFLDEESSLKDEWHILYNMPHFPFMQAVGETILKQGLRLKF